MLHCLFPYERFARGTCFQKRGAANGRALLYQPARLVSPLEPIADHPPVRAQNRCVFAPARYFFDACRSKSPTATPRIGTLPEGERLF